MSIIDKANAFIGHAEEVDEGYEVSMRRDAYAQGYQDAIEKAELWLLEKGRMYVICESDITDLIHDWRKAMED